MGKRSVVKKLFVAGFLGVFLVFGAGAAWADRGVTDREILVGCTADLSGPIAFLGSGLVDGARLYFNYINDRGGVQGRRIRFLVEDDGYQSPRAVAGARKLVSRDGVFCMFMVLGSTAANAMYPFLEANGIPLFSPGTQERGMAFPPRRYLFLVDATYTIMGKMGVEYFVEELGMKDPRIAVIYQDDSPGHDWLRGVRIGAAHYDLDIKLELPYRRGTVDFSSQIARCIREDITHIYVWGVIRELPIIMREAQRQGHRATFITSYASMNNTTLQLAGDAIDYSKGLYGFGAVLNFDEPSTNPAMQRFMDIAKEYGYDRSRYADQPPLLGFIAAERLVEAFRRAGPNPTREGLIAAFESFENLESGILPPITFGPGRRDGTRAVGIGKATREQWVSLLPEGEWYYSRIEEY